jgi:hypothetical protein
MSEPRYAKPPIYDATFNMRVTKAQRELFFQVADASKRDNKFASKPMEASEFWRTFMMDVGEMLLKLRSGEMQVDEFTAQMEQLAYYYLMSYADARG